MLTDRDHAEIIYLLHVLQHSHNHAYVVKGEEGKTCACTDCVKADVMIRRIEKEGKEE